MKWTNQQAKILRMTRGNKKYTKIELARKLKVSRQTVDRFEVGNLKVRRHTYEKFNNFLLDNFIESEITKKEV